MSTLLGSSSPPLGSSICLSIQAGKEIVSLCIEGTVYKPRGSVSMSAYI